MTHSLYKYPRLYINSAFKPSGSLQLDQGQAHYLKNVLRKVEGDAVRVFNGADGEWLAQISEMMKKSCAVRLVEQLKSQPEEAHECTLYFSPLKKDRMDFLIEKSVELGVTKLVPVLFNRSVIRKINPERILAQIIAAAEQCERMDLPELSALCSFEDILHECFFACVERLDACGAIHSYDLSGDVAFLIGPEGGVHDDELLLLKGSKTVHLVSLGECVLRSETAAMACLSYVQLSK